MEGFMTRKIVVTSGKGGVGKTTVLANLGLRFALAGKRVCMIDADVGLNNLDMVTACENLVVYDLADCIEGRCRPKQALIQTRISKNAYVLPSFHTISGVQFSFDSFSDLIEGLSTSFDFILIDCPAGIGESFRRAVYSADEALLVTTPHLSSLRDADKVLANLRGMKIGSVKLVVNRVRGDLVATNRVISPEDIEKTLKCKIAGIIPEDDNAFLCNAGEIPPESPSYKAFKLLARNLVLDKYKAYDYAKDYRGFLGGIRRVLKRSL